MTAVADLPEWAEVQQRNPRNRQLILDQDREQFIATMERWMAAYCPNDAELVPGLSTEDARRLVAAKIMGAVYRGILDRIEKRDYDVFSSVVRIPRPQRAWIAASVWAASLVGR